MSPVGVVTRVIGLWLLLGAAAKLFFGTPADLPRILQDLPLETALTFRLAIAFELAVAALCLLRPARGWIPALLVLLVFVGVLVGQIVEGETNCGCAGTLVTIAPEVMLAFDGALLLLLLVSRPWRARADRLQAPWPAVAIVILCLLPLPWIHDREVTDGPSGGGGYVSFELADWIGRPFRSTKLYPWLTEEQRLQDCVIVIWSESCEVCADHLIELSYKEQGERAVILLKLPKKEDEEAVVETLPEGDWVMQGDLPDTVDWYLTPPVHIEVAGGTVKVALEGMDVIR